MKKITNYLKTLLVAAMVMVGSNAWADVTPVTQNYSSGSADWTSGSTGRYTVDMNEGGYLTVNAVGNGNNGATITGTTVNGKAAEGTDFATSDDFTLIFDLQLNGGNNQASFFHINDAANSGGVEAETGHMLTLRQTSANGTTWRINGAIDKTVTLAKSTWYTFKLSKSESKLYLTVTPTVGGDPVLAQQAIAVTSAKGGLGNLIFQTKRYYSFMAIDNVVLRTIQDGDLPVGTATTYTIKYKDENETTIKNDVVVEAFVDDVVTASAAQTADIFFNTEKYIYKSGNNEIKLTAEAASNVITLVYRKALNYTYQVASNLGTVFANSVDVEGSVVYVPYPIYELKENFLYEAGKSTDWYRKSYTLSGNINETINYSKTEIGNVVFYVEGENIPGATATSANNASIRNSNAAVGYAAGTAGENDITITTLPAGVYQIVANVFTSSSAGGTSTFKLGVNTFEAIGGKSQYNTKVTSDEMTIFESTDLLLQAGGGNTNAVDYIYVIKTGDATVTKSISAAGYATYCSPYALDFSGVSGLTAYIAKVAGNDVTFEPVTSVPANTGVLLKGNEGNYNIPVVASSATDVSANVMIGVLADTPIAAEAGFVLMGSGSANVAFYLNSNAFTVGANTAYIPADVAPARQFIGFDEATAIKAVESVKAENGAFNLRGQRVKNLTKGLYIVNGKKVVK